MWAVAQVAAHHVQYGPYLIALFVAGLGAGAWYIRRIVNKLDVAQRERQSSVDRHHLSNQQAITDLNTRLARSTGDLNNRLVDNAEKLTAIIAGMDVRLGRIEGKLNA